MDDGQRVKRGGVTLCTDSFSSEELSTLEKFFFKKVSLETSIHMKKVKMKLNMKEFILRKILLKN